MKRFPHRVAKVAKVLPDVAADESHRQRGRELLAAVAVFRCPT